MEQQEQLEGSLIKVQLPSETFDAIASYLDRPSDLLSLALVCKSLASTVLTRHIKYRDVALVQLDAKDEIIWNDLLHHPDRTANVRRLEICLHGCCPGLDGQTFIPSFTQIMTLMRHLVYLKLVEPADSSDIVVHSWGLCWKYVQQYSLLETLEVAMGNLMFSSSNDLGFVELRGLRNVFLEFLGDRQNSNIVHKMHGIFMNFLSPNFHLVNMGLNFPHLMIDTKHFFKNVHFPVLRSLRCSFRTSRDCIACIPAFMIRHPTVEVLHWDVTANEEVPTSLGNTLPLLRELSGDSDYVQEFLAHRTENPRPLESIMNVIMSPQFWTDARPYLDATRIVKMDVHFGRISDINQFIEEFCNLVVLCVNLPDMIFDDTTLSYRAMKNAEWGDILLKLPKLRIIRGLDFLDDPSLPNENADRMQIFVHYLPNIEFVDHWSSSRHVVRLIRDFASGEIVWQVMEVAQAERIAFQQY